MPPTRSTPKSTDSRCIVVVEPVVPGARSEAAHLAELGFDAVAAHSVDDALVRLAQERCQAVLLDVELADLDALRRLAATSPTSPVIVLTSLEDERRASWAIERGAADYLTKGHIDAPLLARTLRYATEVRRTRARIEALSADLRRCRDEVARLSARETLLHRAAREAHDPLHAVLAALDGERKPESPDALGSVRASLVHVVERLARVIAQD